MSVVKKILYGRDATPVTPRILFHGLLIAQARSHQEFGSIFLHGQRRTNGCVTMCISSDDSCKKVFVILGEGQILRQLPNSLASQFTARQHNPAVL